MCKCCKKINSVAAKFGVLETIKFAARLILRQLLKARMASSSSRLIEIAVDFENTGTDTDAVESVDNNR